MTDFGRKAGLGDMLKSVYDVNANDVVDAVIAHKTSHQDGGSDEISVAALSGELADAQPSTWAKVTGKPSTFDPSAHKADHQDGGDDEIDCTGLVGTTKAALLTDGTVGRTLRQLHLNVQNGTDADTLKINTVSRFNHTLISEVDNIVKDGTTSGFTLNADGTYLTIEAAILEGNVLLAHGHIYKIVALNSAVYASLAPINDDIRIALADPTTDDFQDWTVLIGSGQIQLIILYVTA